MLASVGLPPLSYATSDQTQEPSASPSTAGTVKPVGVVKAISGNTVTLATDAGPTINIIVQDSTRLVRISPGQKDLKDAAPIQLQDVQVETAFWPAGSLRMTVSRCRLRLSS